MLSAALRVVSTTIIPLRRCGGPSGLGVGCRRKARPWAAVQAERGGQPARAQQEKGRRGPLAWRAVQSVTAARVV
eukprot:scaffold1135_cov343-Prasinococcus_capsulatus_cf.AAC.2